MLTAVLAALAVLAVPLTTAALSDGILPSRTFQLDTAYWPFIEGEPPQDEVIATFNPPSECESGDCSTL